MSVTHDSAVRLYTLDHPDTHTKTAVRCSRIMDDYSRQIVEGYCTDWADYKYRCGQINGLRMAIEQCEDIEAEMSR